MHVGNPTIHFLVHFPVAHVADSFYFSLMKSLTSRRLKILHS